ncbi:MAG TPA: glutamate synthase subunit alpha, partial [Candidatus Limnocylindria bacterium]|nr:glutamate synthase subunit alpha [Candidatus Limnocylindria bacterium]
MSELLRPIPAPLYDRRFEHDACGVGFIADLSGTQRHRVAGLALDALAALEHRGARAADDLTGDGAGVALSLSRGFVTRLAGEAGVPGVDPRRIAIGMCFLPPAAEARQRAEGSIAASLAAAGLALAGWRDVPVRRELLSTVLGEAPVVRQAIVTRPAGMRSLSFRRALATARRRAEVELGATTGLEETTIVSLSPDSIVYKGLFMGGQLGAFYPDLRA